MTILKELTDQGVSIWLDDLSRERLIDPSLPHSLDALIKKYRVSGVTTNPTIFASAVQSSNLYSEAIRRHNNADEAIRDLTCADVQAACDVLDHIHNETAGVDGRVSIEVDPRLAHQTEATIAEGKELWQRIDRPNLLIKVPATRAGLPAIRELIAAGISVNITLIFSLQQYHNVMTMYKEGIQRRVDQGQSLDGVVSVASFFVSRMDTEIDKRLSAIGTPQALSLRGKAGIANARLAYQAFEQNFSGWGYPAQRPLWASTGVKDPNYSDTMYVDQLVAAHCVNTMPEKTLHAVADHGRISPKSAASGFDAAAELFATLHSLGIDYDQVVELLEREGVSKFLDSWNDLISTVTAAMG